MNPTTVTAALGALLAAGTGCAATARLVRGEPTDHDPATARHRGDRAWIRGLSFALALTGSTALLLAAVTDPAAVGTRVLWGLLAVACLLGWLTVGGRSGYDAGASVLCAGLHRPAHRVPRGTAVEHFPEGVQICAACVQADAATDQPAQPAPVLPGGQS